MNDGFIKVTLGGKERPLKFNMRAMEAFAEVKSQGTREISASVTLVYSGLIGWYYANQIEVDFTFSDVIDWVEELIFSNQQNIVGEISKCFQESKAGRYLFEVNNQPETAREMGEAAKL